MGRKIYKTRTDVNNQSNSAFVRKYYKSLKNTLNEVGSQTLIVNENNLVFTNSLNIYQ